MATYREASPEQAAFLASLIDAGLLLETGAPGLLGQGPAFDDVREAFTAAVTRASGSDPVEFDAVPAADLDVRDREERLPVVVPPPGRAASSRSRETILNG